MMARVFFGIVVFLATLQGAAAQDVDAKLAEFRSQIDRTDQQIVDLLNKRAEIVQQVGDLKKKAGIPVAVPAREQLVLARAVENGKKGPLPAAAIRHIYEVILHEMRTWESSTQRRGQP